MIAYTLRPATPDDRRQRWKILYQVWKTAYAHIYTPEEIETVFADSVPQVGSWVARRRAELGYIVADAAGEVIGFTGMAVLFAENSQLDPDGDPLKEGEIMSLYLLDPYHGMGIGRALWNAGLDALREQGCAAAWVWTVERAAAVNFYLHMGCTPTAKGTYTVGSHVERAIGFRIALT